MEHVIIHCNAVEAFNKKFNALATKARKANKPIPVVHMYDYVMVSYNRRPVRFNCKVVEIECDIIRHDGWELLGIAKHESSGWTVHSFNGATIPRTPDGRRCDHCNMAHARSKVAFLSKDGEQRQVGLNCLAAYTGIDPKSIASMFAAVRSLRNGAVKLEFIPDNANPRDLSVDLVWFVAHCIALIKEFGFIRTGSDKSTASMAFCAESCPSDAHIELANQAIAQAFLSADDSDFAHNRAVVAASGCASIRNIGIAACIARIVTTPVATAEPVAPAPLLEPWVKMQNFPNCTVMAAERRLVSNEYGEFIYTSIKLSTETNQIITWFASKPIDIEVGSVINFRCKYKGVDKYTPNAVSVSHGRFI